MFRLMLIALFVLAVSSVTLVSNAAAGDEKDKAGEKDKAKAKDSAAKDDGYKEVVKVQAVYVAGMDYSFWAIAVAALALLALNAALLVMLRSEVAKGK